MNLVHKIMTMTCLMLGTALFVLSLPHLLDYVGFIDCGVFPWSNFVLIRRCIALWMRIIFKHEA